MLYFIVLITATCFSVDFRSFTYFLIVFLLTYVKRSPNNPLLFHVNRLKAKIRKPEGNRCRYKGQMFGSLQIMFKF